jgi:large subunit ribosomal protein L29
MEYAELKGKSKEELKDVVQQSRKELFNIRFQRTTGALENQNRFREVRQIIARAQTELSAQRLGIAQASSKPAKTAKPAKAAKAPKKAKKE